MGKSPIVITGFGRSGTTWLSDILSKVIGGLVLFEPFHPAVFKDASETCYSAREDHLDRLVTQFNKASTELPKNRWLLRNHLNEPLQGASDSFVEYIWNNSEVIGFKTIRANHISGTLANNIGGRLIHIYRHPFAVIASINNRKNFWEEFGWPWHLKSFFERSISNQHFCNQSCEAIHSLIQRANTREEQIILMWGISFIISVKEIRKNNGIMVNYEDLYLDPYRQINIILDYLNLAYLDLHPAHLFTPSLTTLKTMHFHQDLSSLSKKELDVMFWRNQIPQTILKKLSVCLYSLLELDQESYAIAKQAEYLNYIDSSPSN